MAQGKVIRSALALAALLASASAVPPVMNFPMGFAGMNVPGMRGGNPHIGASYKTGGSAAPQGLAPPTQEPTVLNGVERFFSSVDNSMVEGLNVMIQPSTTGNVASMSHHGPGGAGAFSPLGMPGVGGYYGMSKGLVGGLGGMSKGLMGVLGGMYGFGPMRMGPQQLEAVIEMSKPLDFPGQMGVVVFTDSGVTSASQPCPTGPILTEPKASNRMGGFSQGFHGSGSMLGGFPFGLSPMGFGQVEPDFGVIAEVNVQPGLNTFKIQGLGRFTDIDQLAGHGCLVCSDAQIGVDGRPQCVGEVFGCVKLGYTSTPESLMAITP